MIVTSHKSLLNTDSETGLWIGEFTDPYFEFIDQGYKVSIASPKGGKPPIDNLSELTENITTSNKRYQEDKLAQTDLENSLRLKDVNGKDYDALFYCGGHGPMFDLAIDETSGKLIVEFLNSKKPVAAVCHGPAALVQAAEIDSSILIDKRVTGFSNIEETLVFRNNNIPFHLEDKFKWLGANYKSAIIPFTSHVERDGLLVTGQNPLSASPTAKVLVDLLESKTM